MERLSDKAIEITNDLHTERLDYTSEYLPLIKAAQKLSAYEDTDLEPGQVTELMAAHGTGILEFSEYRQIGSKKHLQELAQAEKDRRLAVLPCNVGDTVWTNFAMSGWHFRDKDRPYSAKVVFIGLNNSDEMGRGLINVAYEKHNYMMQFSFSDIGKTVFLTREEAEAALKKREER